MKISLVKWPFLCFIVICYIYSVMCILYNLDADSDDSGNEGNQHLQGRHSPTKSPKREGRRLETKKFKYLMGVGVGGGGLDVMDGKYTCFIFFRLAEELEAKDAEIKSLREELEEKKSFIGRLNTNLLIAQRQLLSWQDCGKGSSTSGTSAADGNVFDSSHHGARDIFHRDSLSPASQTSNRLAGDHDTSVEKVRHNSEMTQSSRRSSEDIEVQDTTVTSSRTDGSLQHRKGPTRNVSEKMDFENRSIASFGLCGFNSDERLYGNARFADRDMFDHSLVVNGHDEASFLENRDFFEDVNKFSDVDDSCVTQRSSFMNRSVAVQSTEVQQLKSRLNVMEDLNMTLKDELQAYENLCSSIGIQSSPRKSPRKSSDDNDLLREHLSEIRSLRIKLEKSLKDSEKLSQKLQQDMEESHSSSMASYHRVLLPNSTVIYFQSD